MSRKPARKKAFRVDGPIAEFKQALNESAELFEHGTKYVEWMMNPDDGPPMRVPDDVVATSAVFKTRNIISPEYCGGWDPVLGASIQTGGTDGETTVIVTPGVRQNIFVTNDAYVNLGVNGGGNKEALVPILVAPAMELTEGVAFNHALCSKGSKAIIPRLNAADTPIYEIGMAAAVNVVLEISFSQFGNVYSLPGAVAEFWYSTDADFTLKSYTQVVIPWDGSQDSVTITLAGVVYVSSFWVKIESSDPFQNWTFSIQPGLVTAFTSIYKGCQTYDVTGPTDLDALDKTYQQRTSAMSLLATYAGTTLANGGLITAARLPMGMNLSAAPSGDYYNFLATMPIYSNDYPLKDGAYTWWCPDSQQEYFFNDYADVRAANMEGNSMLVMHMRRDDPTQDMRLQITSGLEVLTRSNLYVSRVATSNPQFNKLLEFAKLIPAVTENPSHRVVLGRLFKSIKRAILKPNNWLKFGKGIFELFK